MSSGERMLSILPLFSADHPSWTVAEAAEELGIAGSTTYRHFRALTEAGLIVSYAAGRYGLGPAIIEYDRQIRAIDPLITLATPLMKTIAAQLELPGVILLCRMYGDRVICVHQESGAMQKQDVSYERGRPMPFFRGAASKIIFAHLPARRTRALFDKNMEAVSGAGLGTTWEELKRNLRLLRHSGICLTKGELDEGLVGVACPLFGTDDEVVGSIGAAIRGDSYNAAELNELKAGLLRAAKQITGSLVSVGGAS